MHGHDSRHLRRRVSCSPRASKRVEGPVCKFCPFWLRVFTLFFGARWEASETLSLNTPSHRNLSQTSFRYLLPTLRTHLPWTRTDPFL